MGLNLDLVFFLFGVFGFGLGSGLVFFGVFFGFGFGICFFWGFLGLNLVFGFYGFLGLGFDLIFVF